MRRTVVVVGAGMAGLRVATLRAAAGDRVIVLDKGRRHGGRLATRRAEGGVYDTGAMDVAAHSPTFTAALTEWAAAGHAVRTTGGAPGGSGTRWRGSPTMRALPEAIAAASGAEVRLATTVTGLAVVDGRWRVALAGGTGGTGGQELEADALVLTAPAPQSSALLHSTPGLAAAATLERLAAVTYVPSLTVLARPRERVPLTGVAGVAGVARDGTGGTGGTDGTDLALVHRNDLTGASASPALTLQASAAFSAEHLDGDRAAAAALLAAQASTLVDAELEVVHVHGWRYAQVVAGIGLPALRDDTAGATLVLAGDLFEAHGDAPRGVRPEGVERAFVSGGAAARLLEDGEGP